MRGSGAPSLVEWTTGSPIVPVEVTQMPHFGFPELLLIFVIIVILFGTSRLPQLGKGLGEGIRNFKRGLKSSGEPGADSTLAGTSKEEKP